MVTMLQGNTSDGRPVEILKRSATSTLVRTLDDGEVRYLPNAAIAHVDASEGADPAEVPLSVRVAQTVAQSGFTTPQELIELVGACESDLAPVTAHLVRSGVILRRDVGGVTGYIPAEEPG